VIALELFEKEIKKRKREANIATTAFLLTMVLAGLFLMALASPLSWMWKAAFGAAPVVLFVFLRLWERRRDRNYDTPWSFSVRHGSAEEIAGWFSAEEILPDGYFAFRGNRDISCRLMICRMDSFDSKKASGMRKKVNKIINARFHVRAEVSSWDAHKMLRTNLLVLPERTDEVMKWVNRTKVTLTRAECVVNAAYIQKESCLYIAKPGYGFTLSELRRYEAAVRILMDTLGQSEKLTNT